MQSTVITLEKPIPHIGLADWYAKQWANQQTNSTRIRNALDLRNESRQLRNETRIKTEWDTYHNNARLGDRIYELDTWLTILNALLDRVNNEINSLKSEKYSTERELDRLGNTIGIVSECLSMRDSRLGAELTYDDGDTELKTELCVIEGVKRLLIERCQSAWEKINRLEDIKFKLTLDINDKHEAIDIDTDLLSLDRNCANISYKTDPLRVAKNSISYETWLEHSRYTKLLAENELEDTNKLREALFVIRQRAYIDMTAQRNRVDFTLRKRIYETQRARNEIEWQLLKMRDEMGKLLKEIKTLEYALEDKTDALKLASTRLENRTLRPGIELAHDDAEHGLKDEVRQLRQTQLDLINEINCSKATYNKLEDQLAMMDIDLSNKCQSLMTDIRCLDMRARLKTEEEGGNTDTDRNIVLTKMENEIPPT